MVVVDEAVLIVVDIGVCGKWLLQYKTPKHSEAQTHQPISMIIELPFLALQCALTAFYVPIMTVSSSLCYDVLVRGNSLGVEHQNSVATNDS